MQGKPNDESHNRSVTDHLRASRDLDYVRADEMDAWMETYKYLQKEFYLFNAMWRFMNAEKMGTFFMDYSPIEGNPINRYLILDQVIVSKELLYDQGLRLDLQSVDIFDKLVATSSFRPRQFDWKTKKGASDHLPVVCQLIY